MASSSRNPPSLAGSLKNPPHGIKAIEYGGPRLWTLYRDAQCMDKCQKHYVERLLQYWLPGLLTEQKYGDCILYSQPVNNNLVSEFFFERENKWEPTCIWVVYDWHYDHSSSSSVGAETAEQTAKRLAIQICDRIYPEVAEFSMPVMIVNPRMKEVEPAEYHIRTPDKKKLKLAHMGFRSCIYRRVSLSPAGDHAQPSKQSSGSAKDPRKWTTSLQDMVLLPNGLSYKLVDGEADNGGKSTEINLSDYAVSHLRMILACAFDYTKAYFGEPKK